MDALVVGVCLARVCGCVVVHVCVCVCVCVLRVGVQIKIKLSETRRPNFCYNLCFFKCPVHFF